MNKYNTAARPTFASQRAAPQIVQRSYLSPSSAWTTECTF